MVCLLQQTLISPHGCKVVVHKSTSNRWTWSPNGSDGWCLGTAPHYYRCHDICVPKTRALRIVKSVRFFPHKINVPQNTQKEENLKVALKLSKGLENKIPLVLKDTNNTAAALKKLASILLNSTSTPNSNSPRHVAAPRVNESKAVSSPRATTRTSPVVTRGTSESAREKRIQLRNKIKLLQQQHIAEPIKENQFHS